MRGLFDPRTIIENCYNISLYNCISPSKTFYVFRSFRVLVFSRFHVREVNEFCLRRRRGFRESKIEYAGVEPKRRARTSRVPYRVLHVVSHLHSHCKRDFGTAITAVRSSRDTIHTLCTVHPSRLTCTCLTYA